MSVYNKIIVITQFHLYFILITREWVTLGCDTLNKEVSPVNNNKDTSDLKLATKGMDKDDPVKANEPDEVANLKAKIKADKGKKVKSITAGIPRVSGENTSKNFLTSE